MVELSDSDTHDLSIKPCCYYNLYFLIYNFTYTVKSLIQPIIIGPYYVLGILQVAEDRVVKICCVCFLVSKIVWSS